MILLDTHIWVWWVRRDEHAPLNRPSADATKQFSYR